MVQASVSSIHFWIGFVQIIGIDLVLSGDNAVVIALACRNLPRERQKVALRLGAAAAVLLRVAFAFVIFQLLLLPYVRLAGGVLLLWIAIRLGYPEGAGEVGGAAKAATLWAAIRTILIADALMSLDNVVAIAGAAHGDFVLLILGLAISIPLVIYGSTIMLRLMARFPWVVAVGTALIGWVAGDMIAAEPAIDAWAGGWSHWLDYALPLAGIGVALISSWRHMHKTRASAGTHR